MIDKWNNATCDAGNNVWISAQLPPFRYGYFTTSSEHLGQDGTDYRNSYGSTVPCAQNLFSHTDAL